MRSWPGKAVLALLFSLFCCGFALADLADEFIKFKEEKYYLLDKQNFSSFSCMIKAPMTQKVLEGVKAQLNNVAVIEGSLDNFSLLYVKGGGLKFNKPSFEIKAINPESIKDGEKFYAGLEQVKHGLNQQIEGIIQVIQGVFDEYVVTDNLRSSVKSFVISEDKSEASFENGAAVSKCVYRDNLRTTEFRSPQFSGNSSDQFQDIGGHLFLAKSDVRIVMGTVSNTDTSMDISYQETSGLILPSKIVNKVLVETGGMKQEGTFEILLEDYKVD